MRRRLAVTVHQLPGACHVIAWADEPRPRFSSHFDTHPDAEQALRLVGLSGITEGRHRGCGGWAWHSRAGRQGACICCDAVVALADVAAAVPAVAQLASSCHVAACDGNACRGHLMSHDQDDTVIHAASIGDLALRARHYGWRITADGHAYCPDSSLPPGTSLI